MSNLNSALHFAKAGFPIIPTNEHKTPVLQWNEATFDATKIKQWAMQGHKGFGALTGNGWVAVDLDKKKDSYQQPTWFVPSPAFQNTASGVGEHHFYRTTEDYKNNQDREHAVDIRGKGGFVVCYGTPDFANALDVTPEMHDALSKKSIGSSTTTINSKGELDLLLSAIDPGLPEEDWSKVIHGAHEATGRAGYALESLTEWSKKAKINIDPDAWAEAQAALQRKWDWVERNAENNTHKVGRTTILKVAEDWPATGKGKGYDPLKIGQSPTSIVETEDEEWLIPWFVAKGTVTLLAAEPKAGKSTLVWGMLSEIHKKGSFCGLPADKNLRVMYFRRRRQNPQTCAYQCGLSRPGLGYRHSSLRP